MRDNINDVLAIVIVCLLIAAVAIGFTILRPSKRRHRKRHSRRPRIDLFESEATKPAGNGDA